MSLVLNWSGILNVSYYGLLLMWHFIYPMICVHVILKNDMESKYSQHSNSNDYNIQMWIITSLLLSSSWP